MSLTSVASEVKTHFRLKTDYIAQQLKRSVHTNAPSYAESLMSAGRILMMDAKWAARDTLRRRPRD